MADLRHFHFVFTLRRLNPCFTPSMPHPTFSVIFKVQNIPYLSCSCERNVMLLARKESPSMTLQPHVGKVLWPKYKKKATARNKHNCTNLSANIYDYNNNCTMFNKLWLIIWKNKTKQRITPCCDWLVWLTCRERRRVFHSLLQRSERMAVAVTENASVTTIPDWQREEDEKIQRMWMHTNGDLKNQRFMLFYISVFIPCGSSEGTTSGPQKANTPPAPKQQVQNRLRVSDINILNIQYLLILAFYKAD